MDYDSDEDKFDTPYNSLCSDEVRQKEIINPADNILTEQEEQLYIEFQQIIQQFKKDTNILYIQNKKLNDIDTNKSYGNGSVTLQAKDEYFAVLNAFKKTLKNAIESRHLDNTPDIMQSFMKKYIELPYNSILEIYLLNFLEIALYCHAYSHNIE
jgi:hypothetical protein